VGAAPLSDVWTNGQNQIAFARRARGFVAINHEPTALEQSLPTSLPEGRYCDVLSGDFLAGSATCTGNVIAVDASGNANLSVPAESAVALHLSAML
jgi:alpha-amylase